MIDPKGPQAQAVGVGGFKGLDTLSLPPSRFAIPFQLLELVGSSRK